MLYFIQTTRFVPIDYKKYGFKLAGIRKEYYSDNKEDAMIMWNDIKVV